MFQSLNNVKVRTRLFIGFGAVLLLFIFITAVGIIEVNQIKNALTSINEVNSVKQRHAINFRGSVHDRAIELRDVVLFDDAGNIDNALKTIDRLAAFYAKSSEPLDNLMKDTSSTTAAEHEILTEIKAIETRTLPLIREVIALRSTDKTAAHTLLMGQARPAFIAWLAAINKFIDYQEEKNVVAAKTASGGAERFQNLMLLVCAISLVIGSAFAFWCLLLVRPLGQLTKSMQQLAEGDLDAELPEIKSKNEVGTMATTFRLLRESLVRARALDEGLKAETQRKLDRQQRVDKLVSDFDAAASEAVSTIATATTELAQTAQDMSQAASKTNQKAVEVSAASNQTSTTVQTVAASAEEMSASVKEISSQIAKSSMNVREALEETKSANVISTEMLEAARSITTVTELIESIASQINLLALNATIESARAGDAGKGFAIVASEVKNLAGQTTKATEDIRQQLGNLGKMAENVATALVKLNRSVEKVNETSGSIASAVEEQTAVTQEIATNMSTTASAVDQINNNIGGIQKSTETTSAATKEILSASGMLSKKAEDLDVQVRTFLDSIKAA